MKRLTTEERRLLDSVFEDLELLFGRDEIPHEEIDETISKLVSEEAKSYLEYLKEAKPETALSDSFFAGRSLMKKYLFGEATPEALVGDGFIDFKVRAPGDKIILVELKPLFEQKTERVKAGRELKSLRQKPLQPEKHKDQILRYIQEGGEYIILTNLKEWVFFSKTVTAADFEPFESVGLMEFRDEFEVETDLWDYLTRLDQRSIKEDLDKRFFESLKSWVSRLSKIEFTVDEKRKTELIVNLINKFIFVQTLDDYRVIEPRWIQETWDGKERRWGSKGKGKVLKEFFREVDDWFYEYYDTELFRDNILEHVNDDKGNLDALNKNVRLILGLEYWITALGGFRGIMQYNFRYIDEDIFGKAYETFLVEIRKETGVYYTPPYVSLYIANHTISAKLDELIKSIIDSVRAEEFDKSCKTALRLMTFKVLDPACGSGSFLVKALRAIWDRYKELETGLDQFIKELEKGFRHSLVRPPEIERKNEELTRLKALLGLGDDRRLISKIILRHIYGNDLDRRAIEVAKVNLWLEAIKLAPGEFNYRRLDKDVEHILPNLKANLICGDSLVGLSIGDVVNILEKEYKGEIKELSELRDEYLMDPMDPSLVENIQNIKEKIKEKLTDQLLETLDENDIELYQNVTPTFWPLEHWHAFFSVDGEAKSQGQAGFDAVIGNPPYYVEVREHSRDFRIFKASPLTGSYYEAKMDVFYFFVEVGLDLLKIGGNLGFIIMEYWYSRSHAKLLRDRIAHNSRLYELVHFNEFKVFEGAKGQHNDVILLERDEIEEAEPKEIHVIDVLNPSLSAAQVHDALLRGEFIEDEIIRRRRILRYDVEQGKFHLRSPTVEILIQKIEENQNFKVEPISQGLVIAIDKVTGAILKSLSEKEGDDAIRKYDLREGVFVISPPELASMSLNRYEKELIRPYFEAKRVSPYIINMDNPDSIIYTSKTYIDFDDRDVYYEAQKRLKRLDVSEEAKKKTLEVLKKKVRDEILDKVRAKYPTITEHLDKFRKVITSDRWPYGLHRSRDEEIFESSNKIIGVRKTKFPKFVWVPQPCYMAETVNYILPNKGIDSLYLTTLLNSTLMWFWFKYGAEKTHGEQLQIDKEILEMVPLKISDEDVQMELKDLGNTLGSLCEGENTYLSLWRKWSSTLGNGEISLWDVMAEDQKNLRIGEKGKTWTKEASFFPSNNLGEEQNRLLSEEFDNLELSSSAGHVVIFGADNGKTELLRIEFENLLLMEHIVLSIHLTLESQVRVKSLEELLRKTKLPIVKPNRLENTPRILQTVHEEFEKHIESKRMAHLDILANIIDIWKSKEDTKAQIDSSVFHLYSFESNQAKEVMEILRLPPPYQQKVLDFFQ